MSKVTSIDKNEDYDNSSEIIAPKPLTSSRGRISDFSTMIMKERRRQ